MQIFFIKEFKIKNGEEEKGKQKIRRREFKSCIYSYYNIEYQGMSLKDFQIISKLGEGTYSTVYKVKRFSDDQFYALKRVKLISLSSKQKENALNQIRILASIRHPNVICYKEAFIDENTKSLCIVMEFANNGDLSYRITEKQKKNSYFSEQQIWEVFIQVVKGLKELHDFNIFHRDIKSANVFLHQQSGERIGKLGDMNVSKISEQGLCMTQTGTPYYASPQVWKDKPYNEKSDIWSLGCVLYEMITLKPPFTSEDMEGLYKKVVRGIYPKIPNQFSQDLSTMVRILLQTNPQSRPSCQKILRMPLVVKKMKKITNEIVQKTQLLRTIKAGQNFTELVDQLPKANYLPMKAKKEKGIKSLIETIEEKNLCEVESLPMFEKEKKIKNSENSERLMLKNKNSANVLSRERKKSEMAVDRIQKNERVFKLGLELNAVSYKNNELKLPKVQNRYNKCKQKMNKQNSLRSHKIFS